MITNLFLRLVAACSISFTGIGAFALCETLMAQVPSPMPVQPSTLTEPVSQSAVIAAALLFTIGILLAMLVYLIRINAKQNAGTLLALNNNTTAFANFTNAMQNDREQNTKTEKAIADRPCILLDTHCRDTIVEMIEKRTGANTNQ